MSAGNMERVLRLMAEKGASDVYLSANTPILIKINGQLLQLSDQPLTHTQPRQLLAELLTPSQLEELEDTGELNVGVGISGVGSFRLSGFKQRGTIAAVFRCIPFEIPTLESLNVPPILSKLVLEKRGLILMVGATGTGKSTTLASMLEQRNQQMAGHILTIEDPIEFLFTNKKSVVNQREVGRDTQSLQIGLQERAAPGARLHPDRRDPRPRDDDRGDLVRAVGPPGAVDPARQQQLPRARPDPVVLHARGAAGAARRPGGRPARDRLAAPGARHRRRPHAGGRGAAQHQAGPGADRAGRLLRRQGGDGEVAGRRLADLRAGPRAPDHRRPDHARRGPRLRRLADQPDVAAAERHDAGVADVPKKEENDDQPSFTEITLDVRPEEVAGLSPNLRRF